MTGRDVSAVRPAADLPPLWTVEDSRTLRNARGSNGRRAVVAAGNHALKYVRRLVSSNGGRISSVSVDVSHATSALAGAGPVAMANLPAPGTSWHVPVWVQDQQVPGGHNQSGYVDFRQAVPLNLRLMLAQLPENIFEGFWADGNQLQKISFEAVCEIGVYWEEAEAVDFDIVFWGSLRRLHCHPHRRDGAMAVELFDADAPMQPAEDDPRRNKGPQQYGFLVGGQNDALFLANAYRRREMQLDYGLIWFPEDPLNTHDLEVLSKIQQRMSTHAATALPREATHSGRESHRNESHRHASRRNESHRNESHTDESHRIQSCGGGEGQRCGSMGDIQFWHL